MDDHPHAPQPPLSDAALYTHLLLQGVNEAADGARHSLGAAAGTARQAKTIHDGLSINAARMARDHSTRATDLMTRFATLATGFATTDRRHLNAAARDYVEDAAQRVPLVMDALRKRGDAFLAHEAAGCPPVLIYDHEVISEGRDLPRPCNYRLLRIVPPDGMETIDAKRPYIIIDPRAGHGAGIGGFKLDSQVGVALKKGHPVYFVAFSPDPEPTQTLADVTRAEAAFVRTVIRRHPDSNKPIVIGNCQGGWATAILAATNPDISGPVVLNGAPMSYWSGRVGENPMRYNGGLLGGVLPVLMMADLAGGKFDGAHLVQNFEMLNPSRNFFTQYHELFRHIDTDEARFLEFQKWWGGYFWMNEAEIRWIVENLFIGNRLARGKAELEPGVFVDLRNIRAPIIVFASRGDNITPPQQALNWIVDAYASEDEIRLAGQRIVYMVHEKVGHLGIFVSSTVALREHAEMASTMKTIEALAPGLYEMTIEDVIGQGQDARFEVSFHSRKLGDLAALDDGREDEQALAAVARASETAAELYDMTARPTVKAMTNPLLTAAAKASHPLRVQRWAFGSWNPAMRLWASFAEHARAGRRPVTADNPFVAAEQLLAEGTAQLLDAMRDARDMAYETAFLTLWANPAAIAFGESRARPRATKSPEELMLMREVQTALRHIGSGGLAEAVIRVLIVLAAARGSVRRDRLERSAYVLNRELPFADLSATMRAHIIHEQSIIAQFEPDAAIDTLPRLLRTPQDATRAIELVRFVLGPESEMADHTKETLSRIDRLLQASGHDRPPSLEAAE